MNAAVVKLDSLADAVGASTQNHYLASFADRNFVRGIIGGKIICGVFDATYRDGFPSFNYAQTPAALADLGLGDAKYLREVSVSKAVLLCLD